MDRSSLVKSVQTSSQLPLLEGVVNSQLYTGYRVVIYRMNTEGVSVDLGEGIGKRNMDYLLNLDPSNSEYVRITNAIAMDSSDKLFFTILNSLYGKVEKSLLVEDVIPTGKSNQLKKIYKRGNLVNEFDITPLVTGIQTTLDIEGINSCSINCLNPALADIQAIELNRMNALNPWLQIAGGGKGAVDIGILKQLKAFKFREYDLVRVYTYSSRTKSLSDKVAEIKKTLNSSATDDLASLLTEYSLLPTFTGFVQSVDDSLASGSVATVSVGCVGISRVLSQTSIVADQALANNVILSHKNTAGNTTNMKVAIAPTANIFMGNSSLEVFVNIMKGCFYPHTQKEKDTGEIHWGKPNILSLWKSGTTKASDLEKPITDKTARLEILNVIPLFPSLVCLHYLKEKFSEFIFYCDDALLEKQEMVESKGNGFPIIKSNANMLNTLRPYMLMLKTNFELYESTYQSPMEVLQTIKDNAYMEIFEDRTGSFRFRFPKYNNAVIDVPLGFDSIVSISMNRSDSNNFSIIQTRFVADLIGGMKMIPPDVFVDGLSMLRFGVRMSGVVENPNAIAPMFSAFLGSFLKYYAVLRESRTATLKVVGNPKINLGQMVSFRYGYKSNYDDREYNNGITSGRPGLNEYHHGDYVGYVTNISEGISSDQPFSQTLTLKYVRDAEVFESKKFNSVVAYLSKFIPEQLYDGLGDLPKLALPLMSRLFVKGKFSIPSGIAQDAANPIIPSETKFIYKAAFSYIVSALDLANFYISNQQKIDGQTKKAQAALASDPIESYSNEELIAREKDVKVAIDASFRELAISVHKSKFADIITTTLRDSIRGGASFYLEKEYTFLENHIQKICVKSYDAVPVPVMVSVYGVPDPNYRTRAIGVTRKNDYDVACYNLVASAQQKHYQIDERRFNFKDRFTKLLAIPPKDPMVPFPSVKERSVEWDELWKAFFVALQAKRDEYVNHFIPEQEAEILKLGQDLDGYENERKRRINEISKKGGLPPLPLIPPPPPVLRGQAQKPQVERSKKFEAKKQ